ncbi:MAG: hydrolase [Sphingorhabdus sp.]|nr:hydrolase [Sphingorhabdus sp.]|tara:strand:- start:908 stop:1516 length:609 start_codon:yes stop_codon:yes gene_type:complete
MPPITTVIFDIGHVLFQWDPRFLFEKLIDNPEELDWFLGNVVTKDWHFQADTGRPLALMLEERIAEFPDHEELIRAYAERWNETVPGPICGSHEIVRELSGRGVPLYAITNFGHEFWAGFRPEQPIFDLFADILVSGTEKLMKPDAAIYALAIERFGVDPAASLFIDDRIENVRAAEAAGMHGHVFQDAETLRAELERMGLL